MTINQQTQLMQLAHNLEAAAGAMQNIAQALVEGKQFPNKEQAFSDADAFRTETQEKLWALEKELGDEWKVSCEMPARANGAVRYDL